MASNPLARLLEDKRAAVAARDRLIERMKRNAAPKSPPTDPVEKPASQFEDRPPPPIMDDVDPAATVSVEEAGLPSSSPVTVEDVLKAADISVRLDNRIRLNSLFREWTVARARKRRDEFIAALYRLQDMGRKTVDEVTGLLDRFARQPWIVEGKIEEDARRLNDGIPLKTPLIGILRTSALSTSLGNSLLEDIFDGLTLQDYLSDRTAVIGRLRRLPSAPKRKQTETEMVSALDSVLYIADNDVRPNQPSTEHPVPAIKPIYDEPIYDELIVDVLRQHDLSVRLGNVIASGAVDHVRVRDFVQDPNKVRKSILDINNSGRVTTEEALHILSAYVAKIREGRDDDDFESSLETSDGLVATGPADNPEAAALPPRERVLSAIRSLPEREVQVLNSRYGLGGHPRLTLQEIADTVHVSRQRVNQVEMKALRRLKKGPAGFALAAFIEMEREFQWAILAGPNERLSEDELSERARKLDPLFVLAVDAMAGGVKRWLDDFVRREPDGWARDLIASERRSSLLEKIDRVIREFATPTPLFSLQSEIGEKVDVVKRLSSGAKGWTIFEDYLCTGFLGPKARRTVRLHLIGCLISENSLFDIGTLVRNYRDMFPEDEAGSRVIQMQLEEAPHLFASFFDGLWLVLPPTSRNPTLDSLPFEHGPVRKDDEFTEGSTGERILRFLEANGPQRLTDIADHATAAGDTARASVGATLAANACFRRVAPGFYGLYCDDEDLRQQLRSSLLNESHCRLYCLARHSGAPADYYPAWGSEFEMDLAHWAEANAPSELFRSLLSVIEPREWPIPANLAAAVLEVKNRESQWSIGAARRLALGHRFVDPNQFLSILAHLAIFGWIGWCAVNRLSGARFNNGDAADVLAFLMLAGLVEPQDDWQACHLATPLASQVFQTAAERRHKFGHLAWDDDVLAPILASIETPERSLGWVEAGEARSAIEAWRSGQLSSGRAYDGGVALPLDIEETFASPEWQNLFGAAS
jgi:hypothetical protein